MYLPVMKHRNCDWIRTWVLRTGRLLVLLLLTAAFGLFVSGRALSQTAPPKHDFVVPIQYDTGDVPYALVLVRINGSVPLRFIVDTGCNPAFVITDQTYKLLHLGNAKPLTPKAPHLLKVGLKTVEICTDDPSRSVHLSTDDPQGLEAGVIVRSPLEKPMQDYKIAGYIGFPILRAFSPVRFDFIKKTLTLRLIEKLAETMQEAAVLPLSYNADKSVCVSVAVDNAATLVFDTGAMDTVLPDNITTKTPLFGVDIDKSRMGETAIDGIQKVLGGFIPQMQVGKYIEKELAVCLAAKPPYTLGMKTLSRYRITLDIANSCVYLEHNGRVPLDEARRNGGTTTIPYDCTIYKPKNGGTIIVHAGDAVTIPPKCVIVATPKLPVPQASPKK